MNGSGFLANSSEHTLPVLWTGTTGQKPTGSKLGALRVTLSVRLILGAPLLCTESPEEAEEPDKKNLTFCTGFYEGF